MEEDMQGRSLHLRRGQRERVMAFGVLVEEKERVTCDAIQGALLRERAEPDPLQLPPLQLGHCHVGPTRAGLTRSDLTARRPTAAEPRPRESASARERWKRETRLS